MDEWDGKNVGYVVVGHKYRNGYNSSYRAPNEVIPKRGERSRFEFQFRLKNHLI